MKFISRVRFGDDFNPDLLLNVFLFLTPQNIAQLSRVSKLWYKLTNNERIWKDFSKEIKGEKTEKLWKTHFIDSQIDKLYFDGINISKNSPLFNNNKKLAITVGKAFTNIPSDHLSKSSLEPTG